MSVTRHRVGELVRQRLDSLSPAERRLARALLATYPIVESVARFAERARVSPPTVTRFITKLGFHGYPEFQENLRDEVQARLSSPLERYREEPQQESPVKTALDVAGHNLKATLDLLSDRDVNEAVDACPCPAPGDGAGRPGQRAPRPVPGRPAPPSPPGDRPCRRRAQRARPAADRHAEDRRARGLRLPALPAGHDRVRQGRGRRGGQCDPLHRPVAVPRLRLRAPGPGHERGDGRAVRLAGWRHRRRRGGRRLGPGQAGGAGGDEDAKPGALARGRRVERGRVLGA